METQPAAWESLTDRRPLPPLTSVAQKLAKKVLLAPNSSANRLLTPMLMVVSTRGVGSAGGGTSGVASGTAGAAKTPAAQGMKDRNAHNQ
jgi:hypothetical protein